MRTPTLLALVLLTGLLAFGRVLDFGFVWDDHLQVEQNAWLRAPGGLRALLTRPSWAFNQQQDPERSNYYRPLFLAGYAGLARTGALEPRRFHAASLLLHGLNVSLVLLLARRFWRSDTGAVVAALAFLLHPAQAESVAWVAAQGDLLCACFALLALGLATSRLDARLRLPGVCLLALACALSKESGAALTLVLALGAWLAARSQGLPRLRWSDTAAAGLGLLVYLGLRASALGLLVPVRHSRGQGLFEQLATASALLARHAAFWTWPWSFGPQLFVEAPASTALTAGGAAVLLVVAVCTLRKDAPAPLAFGLAAALAWLLPALDADAIGRYPFATRYLYLPAIGLCLGLGGLVAQGRRIPLLVAACWLAGLALDLPRRLEIYRSDASYFAAGVEAAPRAAAARNGLGIALEGQGDLARAEQEFRAATTIDPTAAVAWSNLGGVLDRRGDVAGALAALERARNLAPLDAVVGARLARLHRQRGDSAAAAAVLDELLANGRAGYDVLVERGLLFLGEGQAGRAQALLERAVEALPQVPRGHYLLAQALAAQGRLAEAERACRTAIAQGAGAGPYRLLARLLTRRGDTAGAREALAQAESRAPGDRETDRLRRELPGEP